jgi:outer membrane protein assembly factor BamB
MPKRLLHISTPPSRAFIVGGDFSGILYKFSTALDTLQQSDPLPGKIGALYAITCNDQYVYARDMQGNLIQWDIDTLAIRNILYLSAFCEDGLDNETAAIPTVSHGLFLWKDRVLINNPYGDLLQFNSDDLHFIQKTNIKAGAFIESLDTSDEKTHILSDCAGSVWYGHLDNKEFENRIRLDYGPIHSILYDARHNRHWMTTDNHGGFSIVSNHGKRIKRIQITNDDCEWLAMNQDATRVYVACFDHHLYIFDNAQEQPQLIQKIGPFKFQLKQVLHLDADHTYVLLESGELYCIDAKGAIIAQAHTGTNCIWDIVADPAQDNAVLCPLEDGGLAKISYRATEDGIYHLRVEARRPSFGFGRMRRVKPLADRSFVAGCTNGTVFRANSAGGIEWSYRTNSIIRDVAIDETDNRCVVVNEAGEILQFDLRTGSVIWSEQFEQPLWAVAYYQGDILVSERCMSARDEDSQTSIPTANLYQIDAIEKEIKLSVKLSGNIKRIKTLDNGNILINGNGDITAIEYDLANRRPVSSWAAWQLNTCEDVVQMGDYVHTVTYGYQLNTYERSGKIIDSQFSPDNYPKAVYGAKGASGTPLLLVAGRGPYISLYHVRNGLPSITATLYLS